MSENAALDGDHLRGNSLRIPLRVRTRLTMSVIVLAGLLPVPGIAAVAGLTGSPAPHGLLVSGFILATLFPIGAWFVASAMGIRITDTMIADPAMRISVRRSEVTELARLGPFLALLDSEGIPLAEVMSDAYDQRRMIKLAPMLGAHERMSSSPADPAASTALDIPVAVIGPSRAARRVHVIVPIALVLVLLANVAVALLTLWRSSPALALFVVAYSAIAVVMMIKWVHPITRGTTLSIGPTGVTLQRGSRSARTSRSCITSLERKRGWFVAQDAFGQTVLWMPAIELDDADFDRVVQLLGPTAVGPQPLALSG